MGVTKVIQVFNCCECPYRVPGELICDKTNQDIPKEIEGKDFEYPEWCPLEE